MPDPIIERAADALREVAHIDRDGFLDDPKECVRAVLRAIREPSADMVEAGWLKISWAHPDQSAMDRGSETEAWQAMIDAAMGEG